MNRDFEHQQRRKKRQMFDYDAEMNRPRRRPAPPARRGAAPMRQQTLNLGPRNGPSGAAYTSAATRARRSKKRKRRRTAKIVVLVVVVLILAIVGAAAGWVGCQLCAVYDDPDNEPPAEETKSITIPEYDGKAIICGLICGIDYDNEAATGYDAAKIGRTDLILYMMYDTVAGKANFLQIPRDSFVGPDAATGGTGKINGLYYHAADTQNRIKALIDVLYEQMGLPTDFYLTVDMDAVKELVAIRGGIDVYVPQNVTDPDTGAVNLPQGWRHFNPQDTEYYLRNRNYGGADLVRLEMQQSFYSALFRDFKELSPVDLVMWMSVLLNHVKVGGLSPLELGGLAQKALGLSGADITFVRPASTGGSYNGQQLVSLVTEDLADTLNTYFRPEGYQVAAGQLKTHTLPMIESIGKWETSVRTMAGIQQSEPPQAA